MTLDDDIDISDEEPDDADKVKEKVNGLTEEEIGNSTSDIEDNDIRETLSDDSDKIKVCSFNFTLYPLYSRVGTRNLVLRQSIHNILLNFRNIKF